jgi:hypothetical protein
MLKHRSRLIGGAGAVVTMAAIAVSGAMTASAAQTGARGAVSGTEHFQMMTTTGTGSTGSVIASGVFTAPAVDHEHEATNTSTFTFANGTILIKHSNGTGTQHFDPKTCLMTINLHGTYKLVSGTGHYQGINGSGKYQLSILAIGARSGGKYVQTKPPVAFHQVFNASGPVSLP